jgi:hypothetical protein
MTSPSIENGDPGRGRPGSAAAVVAVFGLGLVGMLMAHHPMILSGLRRVQTDRGDTRLINYLLEHNYRWYRGDPNHARFWDAPFFYPACNVAAYSDTFLGIAPLYGVFRGAGFAPDTSFQLWMMALSALNYAAMLHLLRRRLGLSVAGSAAGAFLFAFGAARVNRLATPQHLTQFLSLITVDALFGVFQGREAPSWRRGLLWLVATAGVVAQLTSGFYLGWFLVLALGFTAVAAVGLPQTRGPFLSALWGDAPWVAVAAVAGGLVLRSWVAHHRAAEFGSRFIPYVYLFLPKPSTWLYLGPRSWLESWTARLVHFPRPLTEVEQRLGLGLLTTVVCLAGLYSGRDRPQVRLLVLVAALLFLSLTVLPPALVFGVMYGLVLGALAFAFAGRNERPWVFLGVVGLLLVDLLVNPYVSDTLAGFGLGALTLAAWAFVGWEGEPRERLVLGALGLGLLVTVCPGLIVLGLGAAFGGLLAAAAALLGWRSSPRVVVGVGLAGLLLFALLTSYPDHPGVLLVGALAAAAAAAARRAPAVVRPPARALPLALAAGLVMATVYGPDGSAWLFFYTKVPGADALLFVSRVGLMLLIPAALGLGLGVDALLAKGRPWLALGLGAACLAEQGVSTPSFDKFESRRVVAEVAAGVGRRVDAFYYSPVGSSTPAYHANLDAMWAGLETGKPTVNGYSGGAPIGWRPLEFPAINEPFDFLRLRWLLGEWRAGPGASAGRVGWVIGTVGWDLDDLLGGGPEYEALLPIWP